MAGSVLQYYRAAFSARPGKGWLPPNWLFLAAAGVLGVLNPGIWIIGAGLELAYLHMLANNRRFQKWVDSRRFLPGEDSEARVAGILSRLPAPAQQRYREFEMRCRAVVQQQLRLDGRAPVNSQAQGLGRMLWIYLQLLQARDVLSRIVDGPQRFVTQARRGPFREEAPPMLADGDESVAELDERIRDLEQRLEDQKLPPDTRKSLAGHLDILRQRRQNKEDARAKIAFIDAELARMEEQATLLREQVAVSADPAALTARVDAVASTLGDTTRWMTAQRQLDGLAEDLAFEPPPLDVRSPPPVTMERI